MNTFMSLSEYVSNGLKARETIDITQVENFAKRLHSSLTSGGKLITFGNGGSAADAQHFVGELDGHFTAERNALPAIALTTNTSSLTAIGNDYTYEDKLKQFTKKGIEAAQSALITGMGGALLNEALMYKLSASTFITPASMKIADPGSVLALIENVNDAYGLRIDTAILEESVKDFHKQLQELVSQFKKAYNKGEKLPSESMYG